MYRAKTNGGSKGKSGTYYSWAAGGNVDAPKGDLSHVASLKWIGTPEEEYNEPKPLNGTKKEIKAWLDARGVEYDSTALKAELLEVLENA